MQPREFARQRVLAQSFPEQGRLEVCNVCEGVILTLFPRYRCDSCFSTTCGGCFCDEHITCLRCHDD